MRSVSRRAALLIAAAIALPAAAETYWLDYEGNDFPENCGGTRIWNQPYAERWIDDGVFVLDASADRHTCEWYEFYTDDALWPYPDVETPEPGSYFFVQWCTSIGSYSGPGSMGPGIALYAQDGWAVAFTMTDEVIHSSYESGMSAGYEPGVFHAFELRSSGMRTYELYIDEALAFEGNWYDSQWSSKVVWGDGTTGSSSLSRWDYIRMGVAPQPSTIVGIAVLILGSAVFRRGALRAFTADSIRRRCLRKRGHAYGATL